MNKLNHNHPFHMVTLSPWPLLMSFSLMNFLSSIAQWFHNYNFYCMLFNLLTLLMCMYQWWRDVIRESTYQGLHTHLMKNLFKMGMILFIISEILFFISFFWSFFHSSLSPSIEIGMMWPPLNLNMFNPYNVPLLNTLILLSSGASISWSHFYTLEKNFPESFEALIFTMFMALYFSKLQYKEYMSSNFTITDSIYGSTFFMITGFHGIHVIIGTIFILISMTRLYYFHFSSNHHFGYEASIWYWHFVDVVWLFVYIFIYWWGFYYLNNMMNTFKL